jgi:hypothetical protein
LKDLKCVYMVVMGRKIKHYWLTTNLIMHF